MFQEMEKTTNVHIDWQYAGDADWGEQKSLLLAGGDLPDVFFGNNSLLVWIFA
jgi:putative aldouronate transport system substrate-binding protein